MKTYIESFFDKKRNIYIMEGILLIMSLFLHWYRLDEIPFGIHVDEAGMGYDAWCLANFGVDRYLTKFPVYLTNFGGGQSALYAYLCALLLKMTGEAPTVFIMRIPAAIMGIIMLLTGTMLIKEVAGEKAGLLSMILFTICPYFMMQSRFGLDCNLMLPISTIALLFLVKALKTRKKRFFVLSGIFWGITCYAYAISYLIIPFFLLLTLLYLIYTKNIEWKEVVLLGFPIAVIALPLILFVMVNTFQLNEITTPLFTIPRLPRYRAAEFTLDSDVLVANTKKIMTDIFFGDSIKYNALPKYYTMYIVSIPFLILGAMLSIYHLIHAIEDKKFEIRSILTIFFISLLSIYFTLGDGGPNTNKMNAVFGVGVYFVCVGIQFVFHHIGRFKHIFAVALTGAYMMFFVFFVRFYFQVYTSAIYPQAMFEHPCGEAIEFLKEQNLGGMYYLDYDQQGYIYYLISRMESPYDFPVEVEMDHYENIYFKLPEEVYEDSSYVVKETSRKFMDKIEESGFRFTKEKIGYYVVYYPEGK